VADRLAAVNLLEASRAGVGVDREALPGDPTEPKLSSVRLAEPGRCERADHVAAPADPEHQGSLGAGE
jgi:hypothetical protein